MTSNANAINAGIEAAAVTGDRGIGGNGQSDRGLQQARHESLPSGPGDSLPNLAISAMRSAQVGGISDAGAHRMLHNGFGIGEPIGGLGAKVGEAVAIAGGRGARAVADGAGASAIAEGAGATAVAEGRAAHAVAEGPGAHAVAEGAGSRAIAEDGAKAGHADRVLEGRPLEAGGRGQELPLKGEVKQIYAKELLVGHEYRD